MIKVFRDPVHNLIPFDKDDETLVLDLINSPEMQRLKRIKQLGLSYVTYHGGDHSRFSHSLGVAHLAKRMINTISSSQTDTKSAKLAGELRENRLAVIVAALLHDIGHGPFSHTLEGLTGKSHEKWTLEILSDTSTTVNSILSSQPGNLLSKLRQILSRTDESILVKVISSQMDVDRFDFLLRDSIMAGVEYGKYDLEWIIHSLRVKDCDGTPEIVLDISKGRHAVEGYLLARFWMYTQVYYHKTTRGAEVLLCKIFERAKSLHDVYCDSVMKKLLLGNESLTVPEYLLLDDATFEYHIKQWRSSDDKILSDLCGRFLDRKLFKSAEISRYRDRVTDFANDVLTPLKEFAKKQNIDDRYYIGDDNVAAVAYKDNYLMGRGSGEADGKEASEDIIVLLQNGKIDEFARQSDLINLLRNKTHTLQRLYFPESLKSKVTELLAC